MSELSGLLLLDGALVPGTLGLGGERIAWVRREERVPSGAPIVAPGLVDLHVHGFGLCDPLADLAGMARALAAAGTTAFQPTLFPGAPARLGADCVACSARAPRCRRASRARSARTSRGPS
ncbi:MAG: hypothetical protein H6828_10620 [Planctomycetes bacterium]|nr:hypothetical protein [Planctomycetota bacterium]